MPTLTMRRWAELLADPELAKFDGRIETESWAIAFAFPERRKFGWKFFAVQYRAQIHEKMALYFDAGAKEVCLCDQSGAMRFFGSPNDQPLRASQLCPQFPKKIELR